MWKTIFVLALILPQVEEEQPRESENKIVSTRLVAFSLENCRRQIGFFNRLHLYRGLMRGEFFEVSPATVRDIDLALGKYLEKVAVRDSDAEKLKFFTEGIRRIRKIRHLYGGQFLGASRSGEQKLIICCYSVVEDIDEFQGLSGVPYISDGDGANFFFLYNPDSKEFSQFHISGGYGGPFGFDDFRQ